MIYDFLLDPAHHGFKTWFKNTKKNNRPCINHINMPTRMLLESINSIDHQHPCIKHFEKKPNWPCLTSKDFMPKNPCELSFPLMIGGPCSLESKQQLTQTIHQLYPITKYIRAGIYKPRTNAHQFQGLGPAGVELIHDLKQTHHFQLVSEITCPSQIEGMSKICSIFQVGTRNMSNTALLKALGQTDLPIILKRSLSGTYEEWLQSAEYIIKAGNPQVILCERGIRTFEPATRNTFDINAIPYLKAKTNLPIIADTSHGTGHRHLVAPIALAAITAGADGLLIEAHPTPLTSITDANQALSIEECSALFNQAQALVDFLESNNT